VSFLPILIVMVVIFYFLLIRPQRNQQKRHQALLDSIKPGDEVITAGGIYGDVVAVEENKVHLLIAEDVEIEVARRSIANVVPPEELDELEAEADGEVEAAEDEVAEAQQELVAEAEAAVDGAPETAATGRRSGQD
jgi:preprotein translocase subunit YajC